RHTRSDRDWSSDVCSSDLESGLALTAAGVLQGRETGDELPKIQIQLPEIEGAIEANGRIVWKSKSGKEAGVRFVNLGEEHRDRKIGRASCRERGERWGVAW